MKNKSLLTLAVAGLMTFGAVSCGGEEKVPQGLQDATDYLWQLYKSDKAGEALSTSKSYDLFTSITIDNVDYKVDWNISLGEGALENVIKLGEVKEGKQLVDVVFEPDVNTKDTLYTLTATITDADGKTATKAFERVVPTFKAISIYDFIKAKNKDDIQYIQGVVVAAAGSHEKAGSFVITDGKNTIFSYNKMKVAVGDEVILATKYATHDDLVQSGTVSVAKVLGTKDVTEYYNKAEAFTAQSLKDLIAKQKDNYNVYKALGQKCLKVTGIATINADGYVSLRVNADDPEYVVNVYCTSKQKEKIKNGAEVTLVGYVRGVNAGKDNITMQVSEVK